MALVYSWSRVLTDKIALLEEEIALLKAMIFPLPDTAPDDVDYCLYARRLADGTTVYSWNQVLIDGQSFEAVVAKIKK
jgi:hypothetical protein